MERIDSATPNLTRDNIDKLAALFPDVVTEARDAEGNVTMVIDFDALRDDLSDDIVDGYKERYQFTWPGKREAKLEARRPTKKTMHPCPDKSVDWDTTENLYIEGDNLDALKIMHETYAGKVKMIYIDPPYNTGHDFIYDDDFSQTSKDYESVSGEYDAEGGRLVFNTESNGRFHSDWCSMMYPRLWLARDLLTDDGLIFISIDDKELANLKAICTEIFGNQNFVSQITWEKRYTRSNNAKLFASLTDYILVYRKSPSVDFLRESRSEKTNSIYSNPDNDPRGPWTSVSYVNPATKEARPNLCYEIVNPITGETVTHPTNAWKYELETHKRHVQENRLYWGKDGGNRYPRLKKFLSEMDGAVPANLWSFQEVGSTDVATKEVSTLLGGKYFDFPKPVGLIEKMLDIASNDNSLVMDFFSGSGTTAHAAIHANLLDGGARKYILVQLPEQTKPGSKAKDTGYQTICEIAQERIRRAGAAIREEVDASNEQLEIGAQPKPLPDLGFRVLKIGEPCVKDLLAEPVSYDQDALDVFIDNADLDADPLDILFQVLPAFRIPYSATIAKGTLGGKEIFNVNNGQLIACFDNEVDSRAIQAIAREQPLYAVFRDSSFKGDSEVTNLEEIFKSFSPDTVRKVI